MYSIEKYNNDLLPRIMQEMSKLAEMKGGEYAHGDDRLDNFRRNGNDVGVPMETVWRIYAGKHWDSITTYIHDLQTGKDRIYSESIQGRAMDMIVYLTLFIAMVEEREQNNRKFNPTTEPVGASKTGEGEDEHVS